MMTLNQSTILSFIRHGQVYNPERIIYGRLPGFGLSHKGKLQAQCAAHYLKNTNLVAIFSSPLIRARETAEIIHQYYQNITVQFSEHLNEVRFKFEGQPMHLMAERNWDLYSGVDKNYDQPLDIVNRIKPFLLNIRKLYTGQHCALVTHGDVIAFTLLWIYHRELKPENKHTLNSLGLLDDYPAPATITHLIYTSNNPSEEPQLHYIKPYDASLEDEGVSPR
jgi:broad specificity phosphatase PhoE